MKKNKTQIIEYINSLQNYQGYVQFSHRPIDKNKDIFYDGKAVSIEDEEGFIYEAHFCNDKESIAIKQVNESFLVSKTNISDIDENDTQEYISDIENLPKIKMAQIWEEEVDELCAGMKVKKLKKVVFTGFEKGDLK
ncbi:MAG: TIGR04423 family type III CRISPR-associated protein [Sulfurimonas sp.]|nr:TIGR04423 family type III CRISPR-associated protein [Sulfurimonas sp.]